MRSSKLMTPKEWRMEERNASRVLEEESDRLSDEFLRLLAGGMMRQKINHRLSAKLANWDDEHERKKTNCETNNNKKFALPPRYRLKRKRVVTIQTEDFGNSAGVKVLTEGSQSKPTFSISILNPKMEEGLKERCSEKLQRMRGKAASHLRNRFIQHLTANIEAREASPKRNARVHSLNSEPILSHQAEQLIGVKFDPLNRVATGQQWASTEKASKSMEATLNKKKQVASQKRLKLKRADLSKEKMDEVVSNSKLKKSKQFMKLRQLLNMQKI